MLRVLYQSSDLYRQPVVDWRGLHAEGGDMMSANDVSGNNDAAQANARVSFGWTTGTSARSSLWIGETDNVSTTVASRNIDRTKLLKMMTEGASPTVNAGRGSREFRFGRTNYQLDHCGFDSTTDFSAVDRVKNIFHAKAAKVTQRREETSDDLLCAFASSLCGFA